MARARSAVRRSISANLRDALNGTVSDFSAQTLTVPELAHLSAGELADSEVYVYAGTGAGQARRIKTHAQAVTGATLLPYINWTTPLDTTSLIEISLQEFGWSVALKNDAIQQAYDAARDVYLEDVVSDVLSPQIGRHDYPLPAGLRHLSGVLVDRPQDVGVPGSVYDNGSLAWGSSYYDADRGLASVVGQTKLAQALRITAGGQPNGFWSGGAVLYLRTIGTPTPTATLTLRLETSSGGLPSGTLLSGRATATRLVSSLSATFGLVQFVWAAPVFVPADVTYDLVLSTDAAVDASNYVAWGEDQATAFQGGSAALWGGASWSALAGSSFLFQLQTSSLNERFTELRRDDRLGPAWRVNPVGATGELWLRDSFEGGRVRLIGQGQPTAPTADTDLCTLPESFLVPKATAILLGMQGSSPSMDADARDKWALFHQTNAERELPRIRTQIRPNSEIVLAR